MDGLLFPSQEEGNCVYYNHQVGVVNRFSNPELFKWFQELERREIASLKNPSLYESSLSKLYDNAFDTSKSDVTEIDLSNSSNPNINQSLSQKYMIDKEELKINLASPPESEPAEHKNEIILYGEDNMAIIAEDLVSVKMNFGDTPIEVPSEGRESYSPFLLSIIFLKIDEEVSLAKENEENCYIHFLKSRYPILTYFLEKIFQQHKPKNHNIEQHKAIDHNITLYNHKNLSVHDAIEMKYRESEALYYLISRYLQISSENNPV